jgi:hypothetical protein
MSTSYSDHENEEFPDSPPMNNLWGKEKEESAFILFLEQLNSIEFDLPMSFSKIFSGFTNFRRGVAESPEVVRHCLILFFTHINAQQYLLISFGLTADANFSMVQCFYRI